MRTLDAPELSPYLPLLYFAWEDGDLTHEEIAELRAAVPESARPALTPWLDPQRPPSARELAALRRAAERAPIERGDAVRDLERSVGFVGLARRAERPAAHAALDVAALHALLDGRYRDARVAVRALLDRLAPPREVGLSTEERRARVRRWLAVLARAGVGEKAYPARDDDGRAPLGEFIAIFETVAAFDLSLVVKLGVQFGLFGGSIYFLGGEAQRRLYLPRVASLELPGCFAMTELGHGSNVRDLKTLARYDHATRSFDLHTPSEDARKEWIGGAGRDARLATVFAQLEVAGESRGVHAFLVPIRNESGAPMSGVRLEDCGEKMGLNGVDNGRIWFDHVRVPREAMLDAYASINDDGEYESPIASDSKRFFTMLGTLVGGRVSVAGAGLTAAKKALTIAVRYGVQRRQFGPPNEPETLLLDYPTHQRRLLPLLAEAYALHFAQAQLVDDYEDRTEDGARRVEATAAGLKAIATWFSTRAIQECREACGGQGYLAANELADLKADTDVFTTFEGDNTVLMQLVAKSLLTDYRAQFSDAKVVALVRHLARRAVTALTEQNPVAIRRASTEHLRSADFHGAALRFRESSLTASAAARLRKRIAGGMDPTTAFVDVQTHLVALARAHVERVVFDAAAARVAKVEGPLRDVLGRLLDLYALARIEDDLAWFLENGYIDPSKASAIRSEVDALCRELRDDAVALVDAFGVATSAPIAS